MYIPFDKDVLFLKGISIRKGASNGYVLTSDANGKATWQPASGGGVAWGDITGTLSAQTDLQSALNAKFNTPSGTTSQYVRGDGSLATFPTIPSITGLVPYSGATGNVDLGSNNLTGATLKGTTAINLDFATASTLPVINGLKNLVSSAGTGFVKVTAGVVSYDSSTYLTGLTVGTTPIASGTAGRVLFEGAGNILQESANLYYDVTNGRLSLNQGSSPGARLDILAPGTSSTDLAIRVRNSGNSLNLLEQRGNGDLSFRSNANNYNCNLHFYGFAGTNSWHLTNGTSFGNGTGFAVLSDAVNFYAQSTRIIQMGIGTGSGYAHWNQVVFGSSTRQKFTLGNSAVSSFTFYFENTNFGIGVFTGSTTEFGTNATNTFAIKTGTAPSGGITGGDGFQLYSADIVAGNAAPHFRTENGAIVKVYQETTAVGSATIVSPGGGTNIKTDDTFDGYTIAQLVKAFRNQGLLA